MSKKFVSLSNSVAEKIERMILEEKRFLPSEKIPSELELADELGVSRTSVREGVRILIAKQILEIKRGRGTFVTEEPTGFSDPLALSSLADKKKNLKNCFELRLTIEPYAAERAALNITEEEIKRLVENYEDTKDLIKNGLPFADNDKEFHLIIAKATRNAAFEKIIPVIQESISLSFLTACIVYPTVSNPPAKNVLVYHGEILEYIKKGDPEGAGIAMKFHIKKAFSDLQLDIKDSE